MYAINNYDSTLLAIFSLSRYLPRLLLYLLILPVKWSHRFFCTCNCIIIVKGKGFLPKLFGFEKQMLVFSLPPNFIVRDVRSCYCLLVISKRLKDKDC